jgi:hypothetical protein
MVTKTVKTSLIVAVGPLAVMAVAACVDESV